MPIVGGYDEPFFAAEKSSFQNVAFKKGKPTVEDGFADRGFFAGMLVGKKSCVALHFGKEIADFAVWGVEQGRGEGDFFEAVSDDFFMNLCIVKTG